MKHKEPLAPDLTPLIDVVFILLIFFIVTSVFKKEELALILSLPKAEAKPLEVEREQINIELSQEKLAYKGKEMEIAELDEVLSKVEDKKRAVIVRIDEEVMYKKIVGILDLLQKYELHNLAMVTKNATKI